MRTLVVTTLNNRAAATRAFIELTNQVAGLSLLRFGDSLLLSLPAEDEAARERWFEDFHGRCTNTFVAVSNAPVMVALTCRAPSEAAGAGLLADLEDYVGSLGTMDLIAPWAPEAGRPEFSACRQARRDWTFVNEQIANASTNFPFLAYAEKRESAIRRGARAEVARLNEEQERKVQALQTQARERLRAGVPRRVDPALLDLHAKLSSPTMTNAVVRQAVYRELAGKLGQVSYSAAGPAPGANACGLTSGYALRQGLRLNLNWLGFRNVTCGLPAITGWLRSSGCSGIRYELVSSGWPGQNDVDAGVNDSE
jgi:hypothetical protein